MSHRSVAYVLIAWMALLTVSQLEAGQEPVSTDDRYRFTAGHSEEQVVSLEQVPDGVRLMWPRPARGDWDTALLAIRSAGASANSSVEITSGSGRVEQYFEVPPSGVAGNCRFEAPRSHARAAVDAGR